MKLKVLGCDGGRGMDYYTTALLFNNSVLIDAGTILSRISIEEALNITDIFFTHHHLDHILEFPFFIDATFAMRKKPLRIHAQKATLDALMKYLFNEHIWPDFSQLPTPEKGQFTLHEIKPEETYTAGGLRFTPVAVNHTVPTVGYRVEDDNAALIFSGDTGPTDRIWEIANKTKNLKAAILDLSFPNDMQNIADASKHMTANDVAQEVQKISQPCDIYTFHFKVAQAEKLKQEMANISHANQPIKALRDFNELTF